jgi:1-acyl-sn-glycerol-3-phosphate acyltransferase
VAGVLVPLALVRLGLPSLVFAGCSRVHARTSIWLVAAARTVLGELVERVLGVRIVVHGAIPVAAHPSLIVSSHPTLLDWFFLFSVWSRMPGGAAWPSLPNELNVFVAKEALKRVPVFGWAMQLGRALFLSRQWASDQQHVALTMRSLAAAPAGLGYSVLLFPEGTALASPNAAKNAAYARAHGLPEYRHVLHPHVTGFASMFVALARPHGSAQPGAAVPPFPLPLARVYDTTIAYEGPVPRRPSVLAAGPRHCPRAVHVWFESWTADEVWVDALRIAPPAAGADAADLQERERVRAAEGLGVWLQRRFALKEQRLAAFYGDDGRGAAGWPGPDRDWPAPLRVAERAPRLALAVVAVGVGLALTWLAGARLVAADSGVRVAAAAAATGWMALQLWVTRTGGWDKLLVRRWAAAAGEL